MKRLILTCLIVLLVGCIQPKANPKGQPKLHNGRAVVEIDTSTGQATGFLTIRGYIITAGHAVQKGNEVEVEWFDKTKTQARVKYTHELDYAFLKPNKIPKKATQLIPVRCCYPDDKGVYDSFGYPHGKRVSKQDGVISLGVTDMVPTFLSEPTWIRYFKNIKPGMSGAPLIRDGTRRVYGVLVMKRGSVAQAVPTKKINFTGWGPMGGETCEQNLK